MSGIREADGQALVDHICFAVFAWPEQGHHRSGVLPGVKRFHRFTAVTQVLFRFVRGVCFLDMGAVGQHD